MQFQYLANKHCWAVLRIGWEKEPQHQLNPSLSESLMWENSKIVFNHVNAFMTYCILQLTNRETIQKVEPGLCEYLFVPREVARATCKQQDSQFISIDKYAML